MGFVKKYVLNEIRLKVLAITLALMLWISMNYLGESTMAFSVPVNFEGLNKTRVVREADTRDILITLNGPLSVLKNLKPSDIKVVFNLSGSKEGRQILTVRKSDVVVPNGLKIETVKPDYVVVEVDRIVEKELRTVVKLDDKWAHMYRVASWYPRSASVEGPKELLDKSDFLETIAVDGNFTGEQEVLDVPLDMKHVEGRKVKPETVRVVLKRVKK
jgi:hypothetical protein